ncbi:MAG: ABC transporter permease, partial [Gammaproteobacteria bacterium]|nr:ABC transporter permease [Gammaproteobacteria bacterium]
MMLDIKLLWRDWRGGQLNLIVSALVLAVMVVTAVSLLADRVERGLSEQISSFLAADLALQGGVVIEPLFHQKATELELETANISLFRSMVFAGDTSHLASVKAVDDRYPLRGQIEVTRIDQPDIAEFSTRGPQKGEVWVEARLLNLLGIKLGDKIEVGYSQLKVTRLIVNEPDRGTGFATTGARVMMSQDDILESQLIRPGSRITYRLLMAGTETAVSDYVDWYKNFELSLSDTSTDGARLSHYRLRTPENSEQRLAEALQRGRSFLLLSGTIGVLLAGLAMALASQRYASRLTDQVALMKAWGRPSNAIRRSQLIRLLVITSIATVVGIAMGWIAHYFLLGAAKGLFEAKLPLPGARPYIVALITGFVSVIGFALPALWHLPTIAPLKVLRRDLPDSLVSQGRRVIIGIGSLLGLTYWYSGSLVMSLMFLGALFVLFAICAFIALQSLKLVKQFGSWRGSYVRLGLANLWRRRSQTMVQLVGFSVTLMLLVVTTGMRTNLISEWQEQLPEDAPTHFLLNVTSAELPSVKALLAEQRVIPNRWYPMVRGRLVGLNQEPLTSERLRQTDGLAREVNFTQAAELPADNSVVEGQWWNAPQSDSTIVTPVEFSMEQEVASQLGVKIGDQLEFSIGGLRLDARLSSIRTVNWQSMNANFYIIFSPGALDRFAPNWISSVRAPPAPSVQSRFNQQAPFIGELVKRFPTAMVVELGEVIKRIRDIINRVTLGLEMILLLVLACGGLVLFAAI